MRNKAGEAAGDGRGGAVRFEHPWMLLGALAAAIPVLIHLSHRRWAPEIPFAAIDFLLLSDKRLARRARIRQLLVLLARVLLIAAVLFALAKPYTESMAAIPVTLASPTSVVLIIDNSASMGYEVDGDTLLERAIKQAETIIKRLPPSHNLAVVTAAQPARKLLTHLVFDHAAALRAVRQIRLTERATDTEGALRLAEQLLAGSRLPRRQTVLLSDLTVGGWPDLAAPWMTPRPPEVRLVDLARGEELANTGVVDVTVQNPADPGDDASELHVTVRNDRATPWHDLVTLRIGEKVQTGFLKVPPRGEATKVFRLDEEQLEVGFGSAALPGDALPLDDVRAFTLGRPRQIRVLVLNGAPRSVPYLDETFFLERALRPSRSAGVIPVTMTAGEFTAAQLAFTDVVMLANVGTLAPDQVDALAVFVREGGGLFITGGDNVTPEAAEIMGELLPLPVRELRRAGRAVGGGGLTRFARPHRRHAVFAPFQRDTASSLFEAQVSRYTLLESAAREGVEVLLAYVDGAPALVQRELGEGRILMMTTSIDRDWTDLPIRTSYLPLVQRVVHALAEGRTESGPDFALVGEPLRVPVPRRAERTVLLHPDGARDTFEHDPDADPTPLDLPGFDRAGIYALDHHVAGTDQVVEHRVLAVGPDPRELSLERVAEEDLARALAHPAAGGAPEETTAPAAPSTPEQRTRHWPVVLLGLFGLLFFETWLVVRG